MVYDAGMSDLSPPAADVAAITDRTDRLVAASQLLADAHQEARSIRAVRDMATCVAVLDDHVAPVTMWRDALGVSRTLYTRILQRAPAQRPRIPDAVDTAATASRNLRDCHRVIREARQIRDDTALQLMNGVADDGSRVAPVTNREVSRLTGRTTARVAQIRGGAR